MDRKSRVVTRYWWRPGTGHAPDDRGADAAERSTCRVFFVTVESSQRERRRCLP